MGSIYKILNKITNECYIGSALNFDKRKYYHLYDLKHQKHHSPILQNSWNKYGEDVFLFKVIEEVKNNSDLIIREQFWIDKLNPKYNISKTAGSPLGIKHNLQSRMNMSNAHRGKSLKEMGHKDDCRCCICFRKKGKDSYRYIKRETRFCICGCGKTFDVPINSLKKFISGHNKSRLGTKKTEDEIFLHKIKIRKPIIQYSLEGIKIHEWDSIKTAAKTLHIDESSIIRTCKGKRKSYKNFIWKYKN